VASEGAAPSEVVLDLPPSYPGPHAHLQGSILFVGNATTVIEHAGFALLTDPNFLHAGDHAHLGYGLRSKRLKNPALEIQELPPLDACVLSHLHGDHWDRVAEAGLPKTLPILTTQHAARVLRGRGFRNARGLDTWQRVTLRKGIRWLRVTSLPAQHGPALVSKLLPPTMGSMLEWGEGTDEPRFRLWISGDTLVHDRLHEIPARYPDIPLALIHLGGTRVLGILVTMDAAQGVEALRIVRPRTAVPIHFDDYTVFKSPLRDFLVAAEAAGLATRLHVLERGDRFEFEVPTTRGLAAFQ